MQSTSLSSGIPVLKITPIPAFPQSQTRDWRKMSFSKLYSSFKCGINSTEGRLITEKLPDDPHLLANLREDLKPLVQVFPVMSGGDHHPDARFTLRNGGEAQRHGKDAILE